MGTDYTNRDRRGASGSAYVLPHAVWSVAAKVSWYFSTLVL